MDVDDEFGEWKKPQTIILEAQADHDEVCFQQVMKEMTAKVHEKNLHRPPGAPEVMRLNLVERLELVRAKVVRDLMAWPTSESSI